MAINLRPPSQAGGSAEDRLRYLYSYLYQMTEQLNQTLDTVETSGRAELYRAVSGGGSKTGKVPQTTTEAYQQLKSLIIKTATDVTGSMRKIVTEMSADFVAQSEYGTYSEYLNNKITQSAEGYVMEWDAEQGITTGVADFSEYRANSELYMKLGIVKYNDDGTAEAGVVIGRELQTVTIDDQEIIISENVYSLLTADQLSFWQNGARLAYVSLTDFFVDKAYINEVTTDLIQSKDKGAQLALNEGLLEGIAENIDLTANESITLLVGDEVSKATVELDDRISLVVAGTDSEGKVVLTEDALTAIADEIVLTTAKELESEGGTVIINDAGVKMTGGEISMMTNDGGKAVIDKNGVSMTGGEISMDTSDGGKAVIDKNGVSMTGGSIKLGSGGNTVFISDEVLSLSGSNAESGASTVAIRGGGITMAGSEISVMSGGNTAVKINQSGIDMNGSAISMQTTADTEMLLDEQGVSMTGGRILLQSDDSSLVRLSKTGIIMSGSMFKMATSGSTDGVANAVKIDANGLELTGGRIYLNTIGQDNLIKLATSDGGSIQIDKNGIGMTGGAISMAATGGGYVTITKDGVGMTGGRIYIQTTGGEMVLDKAGITMTGGAISMNANTELNVNAGKFGVSTADYSLSLVKDDGNEVVMDIGDDGYTTMKGIHAGNVREAVYGTLSHTTATLGSLTGLASLLMTTDARHVEYTMTKDEYVDVTFSQFSGSVKVNANGHRLPFIFVDGSFSGSVMIDNGILAGTTKQAMTVANGRVFLYNCWFAGGSTQGIYAYYQGEVNWINGASTPPTSIKLTQFFMWAHVGGTIRYNGYIPGGEIWCGANLGHVIAGDHVTVLSPASGSGGGTVDTTKSATLTATLGWISDKQSWKTGTMYQGYTTGKGKCYGCMRFTLPGDVTTVISATLTLHRVDGVGRGSTVEANLYSSTSAWGATPSNRTLRTSKATAPAWNQSGDIEATAAAQALADGATQLVLFQSGETATLSGKVYSYNYAQFDSAVLNIAYR